MASVSNEQTQVVLPCKVDTGLNMFLFGGQNDILRIEATGAGRLGIRRGKASVVGIEWPQIANRMVGTD